MSQFLIFLSVIFLATGCMPQTPPPAEKTQLEIRELQTRTYDVQDPKLVMKTCLHVLQDDNFIVKNVALDLGFLTATKEIDIEKSNERFLSQFVRANEARWPKHEIIEATVSVTEFGKKTRIRVNFQSKVNDNRGAVISVKQITDEKFYQEFFSKVDKGLFLQQQEI